MSIFNFINPRRPRVGARLGLLLGLPLAVGLAALAAGAALPGSAPAPAALQEESPRALALTLRPAGFDEAEITTAAGEYLLVVSNRTGLEDVTFRLDRGDGGRLYEGPLPGRRRFWSRRARLAPGTYVLSAGEDPAWACRITVTP